MSISYVLNTKQNLINSITSYNETNQNIPYIYTAKGKKVAKQMTDGTHTYYAGNFVYNGNTLHYILFDKGQIKTLAGDYVYQYSLKDHLGNTSLVQRVTGETTEIIQQTDYYPFGMIMGGRDAYPGDDDNKYLYNNKLERSGNPNTSGEFQDMFDLGWYDYVVRFYDAEIARWQVVRP